MRLAFFDGIRWDYRADSAYRIPLGGSQSALCYLTEEMARLGHEVFLLTHTSAPGLCNGVHCRPLDQPQDVPWIESLDAIIVLNAVGDGKQLRSTLADLPSVRAKLLLWMQYGAEQLTTQALADPAERSAWDKIVVISDWQREEFIARLGVAKEQMVVLNNAVGAPFRDLFSTTDSIIRSKSRPLELAYTSTPFRGLDVLLDVFPRIREAMPGTTLKVFSSMSVYRMPQSEDEARYGELYRRSRTTEGVEYIGSLPQSELAAALKKVAILAYPNTFAETGCIAAMEAMAAGCWIVTSDLGALPETTAGFARLIPIQGVSVARYKDDFVEATVELLRYLNSENENALEDYLQRQVDYVNRNVTWAVRAKEWSDWLGQLCNLPA
jgi:glycosyltransferase involved in cell wall biosynthesis